MTTDVSTVPGSDLARARYGEGDGYRRGIGEVHYVPSPQPNSEIRFSHRLSNAQGGAL